MHRSCEGEISNMKTVRFPTYNLSLEDSIEVVKNHLDDPNIAEKSKALAVENEDTIYTVVPEGVPAIKILNKDDILPIGAFVQVQEESEQADDSEAQPDPAPRPAEPATPFKPKGAMAEIKREVFIRLQAYQQRTKLGWAQRVSDATGGKVAPDVVRLGLLEARDIGVDRWKLIGKALDKLEEEMQK